MIEAGVPLGVTFSFLISSPMVNEIALIMLLGMFGWKVALLYASTGVIIAIIGGYVIGKLNLEYLLEDYGHEIDRQRSRAARPDLAGTLPQRRQFHR